MIILPILTTPLVLFSLKGSENVLFELGSETAHVPRCLSCWAHREMRPVETGNVSQLQTSPRGQSRTNSALRRNCQKRIDGLYSSENPVLVFFDWLRIGQLTGRLSCCCFHRPIRSQRTSDQRGTFKFRCDWSRGLSVGMSQSPGCVFRFRLAKSVTAAFIQWVVKGSTV